MRRSHWPLSLLSTVSAVLNALLPVVLVRLLSAEDIGLFKILFLYITLTPALTLVAGLINGLAYWSGRKEGASAVPTSGFYVHALAIGSTLLGFFFIGELEERFDVSRLTAVLAIVSIGPAIAARYFEEVAVFQGQIFRGAFFGASFDVVRTLGIILWTLYDPRLESVFLAHALFSYSKLLYSMLLSAREGWLSAIPAVSVSRHIWAYALPVGIAALLGVLSTYADQFILSQSLVPADFALYALGCLALPPLLILEHSVTRVLIPELSTAFEEDSRGEVRRSFRRAVEQLSFLLVPSVLGLFVFREEIIVILFTESYREASVFLAFFAWSYLLLIFPFDAVPRALGKGTWILWVNAIFSLVTLLLTALGAWWYGALGALLGTIGGRGLLRMYGIIESARMAGVSFFRFIPLRRISEHFLVALMSAVCGHFVTSLVDRSYIQEFLLGAVAFAAVYLLFFLVRKRELSGEDVSDRRVLMLIPAFERGGLEQLTLRLGEQLSQRQTKVFAYAFDAESNDDCGESTLNEFEEAFKKVGVETSSHHKGAGFRIRSVLRLAQYIHANRLDVLHSHDLGSLLYGLLARLILPFRIRHIHTQHSFVHFERERKYQLYERICSYFVDHIACVSPNIVDKYIEIGVSESKVEFLANGVEIGDPASVEKRSALKEELLRESGSSMGLLKARWCVSIARIADVKGQRELLETWASLRSREDGEWHLFVIGPVIETNYAEQLQQFVRDADLSHNVTFLPATSRVRDWLMAGEAYCSFSRFEGMPIGPLEALANGVKTCVSDIAGHEFLKGHVSRVSLTESPEERARLLSSVLEEAATLSSDAEAQERRKAQIQFVKENYSIERCVSSYLQLYFPYPENGKAEILRFSFDSLTA